MALLSIAYTEPAIEESLANALWRLGYQRLTAEQSEAVIQFAKGQDVLFRSQLAGHLTVTCDYDVIAPGMWAPFAGPPLLYCRLEVGWKRDQSLVDSTTQ